MWLLNLFGLVTQKEYDELEDEKNRIYIELDKIEARRIALFTTLNASESPPGYDANMRAALKQLSELKQELAKEKLRNSITDELELLAGLSGESCVTEKMKDAISAYSNMQSFIDEKKNEMREDVTDTERPAVH